MIFENQHFSALVPFWAVWPFETIVVGRTHQRAMIDLAPEQRDALADVLKRLTTRYDNLFQISFPYSMRFHQSPTDGRAHPEWHWVRTLLSAPVAFRYRAKVHGGLRHAGNTAARHYRGDRCRAPA
jgi:galactose-1-phosphate uridylyltransferase (family 1)